MKMRVAILALVILGFACSAAAQGYDALVSCFVNIDLYSIRKLLI